jgi:hypothetical protein
VSLRAAGLAGLAAAALISFDGFGVGWPLLGVVLAVLTGTVARRRPEPGPTAPPPPKPKPAPFSAARRALASVSARCGWAVLAVALLTAGALRDAGWFAGLCLLGASATGSLAVAGGRSVRGMAAGAVAVPCLGVAGQAWAWRGLKAQGGRGRRLAGAGLASVLVLAVFTPLLASADAAFARLLPEIDIPTVVRWTVLFALFGAGTIGACYLLAGGPRPEPEATRPSGRLRRLEWGLPVGALVGLFAVFVVTSVRTLFGGDAYVLDTTGLSYAQYARSGFWQLLGVSLLTLVVLAVVARGAAIDTAADRAWLRGMLGALTLLTLVIVGSALSRIWAYQQAYGFTVLRLLVMTMELSLGVLYLAILVAGRRLRAPWLPRAVVAGAALALLGLGALNPEGFVAAHNVARFQATGKIDLAYLSELSADALPALMTLPEPQRRCTTAVLRARLDTTPITDWRAWNPSRAHAEQILPATAAASPPCSG